MNDLKPKPENPAPGNFSSVSKQVPDNTFDEGSQKVLTHTQELPQKITSTEIIDIQNSDPNDLNNIEKFMNTNGAEISRILKNPNDVSQNMTNLDILGMPSSKEGGNSNANSQVPSDKILTINQNDVIPKTDNADDLFGDFTKPADTPKQGDFELVSETPKEPQPVNVPEPQPDDVPILQEIEEPGPPKESGGFEDIFDNVDFTNKNQSQEPSPKTNAQENKPEEKEEPEAPKKEGEEPKKVEEKKKEDEESFEEQYYSPNYYQDTGGYDDEGGDNYYQNNYYGGGSDYEDEAGSYETYKRDDTNKEEPKKANDAVDFL